MQTVTLNISGMTCGGCVNSVTRILNALEGIKHVQVTLTPAQAAVELDDSLIQINQIIEAIEDGGYDASVK